VTPRNFADGFVPAPESQASQAAQ